MRKLIPIAGCCRREQLAERRKVQELAPEAREKFIHAI